MAAGAGLATLEAARQIHTMRPITLQTLTWVTVAAAVASALWLAAVESDPGTSLRLTALPSIQSIRPGDSPLGADALRRRQQQSAAARARPSR